MHWEAKNIFIYFIETFALLRWSAISPVTCLRHACTLAAIWRTDYRRASVG